MSSEGSPPEGNEGWSTAAAAQKVWGMGDFPSDFPVIYTVGCEFTESAVADEWLLWLRSKHLRDVLDAGALRATVMRISPTQYEIHYRFKDRAAYERYIEEHAPRLREEGLRLFPLERGLKYSRHVADVVDVLERQP